MNIVMQNKNYKLIKISSTRYDILDNNNKLVLGMEGKDYTEKELKEQFNNCLQSCIII